MLILSRKKGESIIIGDEISVTVVSENNEGIRLGIKAPSNVNVHREEIYWKIRNNNAGISENCLSIDTDKGLVTHINAGKGFGFISVPDICERIFFHLSGVLGDKFYDLEPGHSVSFKLNKNEKGFYATNIVEVS